MEFTLIKNTIAQIIPCCEHMSTKYFKNKDKFSIGRQNSDGKTFFIKYNDEIIKFCPDCGMPIEFKQLDTTDGNFMLRTAIKKESDIILSHTVCCEKMSNKTFYNRIYPEAVYALNREIDQGTERGSIYIITKTTHDNESKLTLQHCPFCGEKHHTKIIRHEDVGNDIIKRNKITFDKIYNEQPK